MTVPALDSALLRSFPRLFLHFFDTHFLEAKGALNPHPHAGFVSEFRRATRMAVATADKVILPAASYVESEICSSVVNELKELFAFGVITIAGHTPNFQEFHYEKRSEYRRGSRQYSAYQAIDPTDLHPPFLERGRSATSDIGAHWNQALEEGSAIAGLVKDTGVVLPSDFERRWQQVPERLGKLAFIVDHVEELLGEEIRQPSIRYRLHDIINEGYFRSYTLDLKAGVVTDLVYLDAHFEVPSFSENLSYKRLLREIQRAELLHYLDTCSAIELLELRQNPAWLECVHATKSDFTITGAIHPHGILVRSNLMHKLRSFIAHGHDRGLLFELKDYLQTTLHFPEPIILEQQPDRGLTIIEKFETYANGIDVVFVLFTPDDVGGAAGTDPQDRARQNVIFELGYFVGALGRKSGRIILIRKGSVEIPSDLLGIIYVPVVSSIMEAGEKLRRQLEILTPISTPPPP